MTARQGRFTGLPAEFVALLEQHREEQRRERIHAGSLSATVLLVLGVPERTVMSVMGWSSTSMAACYQHVTDPIRREVATRIDGLLFQRDQPPRSPSR